MTVTSVQAHGGPAWKHVDHYQVPGLVCEGCRGRIARRWCASPEHPTFRLDGHLVRPFRTGPKEQRPTRGVTEPLDPLRAHRKAQEPRRGLRPTRSPAEAR
jgi:hypothetical protein